MKPRRRYFATTPKGLQGVLADELRALGGRNVQPRAGGVAFDGSLAIAYRACLWCRTANRILLLLARFEAKDADQLYGGVQGVDWQDHVRPDGSLVVDAVVRRSALRHSHFAALRVKDAVVDQLRARTGRRPDVDKESPDVRLNLYLDGNRASLSLDLSGDSLHRRGYRGQSVPAPLKENLAAGLLLLAGWPVLAGRGRPFLDPMCGSGTLPIEAALIAADTAPGLLRDDFGFLGWMGHRPETWAAERDRARSRDLRAALEGGAVPPVTGFDGDAEAVEAARENVARAGLADLVNVQRRQVADWLPPPGANDTDQQGPAGLLVVNPPYGRRLGEVDELTSLYTAMGDRLKSRFGGWRAAVLSGDGRLSRALRLKSSRRHPLRNGPIDCRLLVYPIASRRPEAAANAAERGAVGTPSGSSAREATTRSPGAEMLANRLSKNLRKMRRWARRNDVFCYRIYDADIPEYNVAIDLYERWAHVSEYAPPPSVDAAAAARRREEALAVTAEVLEIEPEAVFFKVRRRQRGTAQYQRRGHSGRELSVREGGHRFLVNLSDYIDTGLFLDHRLTRAMLGELALGRDVLNLFAYTATGTVYAARAGARSTTSVDLSRNYLAWAQRNLTLNGVSGDAHRLVRADCLAWLSQHRGRYGLIFLDPPTFSTSKAMRGTLDIQRDHVDLLKRTSALLEPDGVLIFSNNFSQFEMDAEALPELEVEDLTAATIPFDFRRTPRIHNTWRIRHRQRQGIR